MIERVFVKDCLSFEKIDLNLKPGLIVFTGASGVGKSVLMQSILALSGNLDPEASSSEMIINFPFDLDTYQGDEEYSLIQQSKKDKNRFFLNDFSISKKKLSSITSDYIDFMNVRDFSIFEEDNLFSIFDSFAARNDPQHSLLINSFNEMHKKYLDLKKELIEAEREKLNSEEESSFLEFEINKINEISPIDDNELIELNKIKNQIVNRSRILELIDKTELFFEHQNSISNLFDVLDIDTTEFEEAMNNVYFSVQEAQSGFDDLEYVDIEEVLNRLDKLNSLVKKYGSIEECLESLKQKEEKLTQYQDIDFVEINLRKKINEIENNLISVSEKLFNSREKFLIEFNSILLKFSSMVLLENVKFEHLKTTKLSKNGFSEINLTLNGTSVAKLSSGELNRLKLVMLTLKSKFNFSNEKGVLILDEIDSNLSGKESESVGKLLHLLSQKYQILSISHQPQLTSFANQHFVVKKEEGVSFIEELNTPAERQCEIARMISGNQISQKALNFADELIFNTNEYINSDISY